LTALNELYVFSKLSSSTWSQIISSCVDFLTACTEHRTPDDQEVNSLDVLFKQKTKQRLKQYCSAKELSMHQVWFYNGNPCPSIDVILKESEGHLPSASKQATVLHGDFCFSNILYDFRAAKIKIIDPRGITPSGEMSLFGDIKYDVAKLSHSIIGLYDWIIAGYYQVEITGNDITFDIQEESLHREIQQEFITLIEEKFGLTSHNLYAMQIQLFLSMLPLHADDSQRQNALFANAFRLYQKLKRLEQ
jgi:hypothetical protein